MPLLAAIALLRYIFEDNDLGRFNLIQHTAFDRSTLYKRCTDGNVSIISNEQDVFEFDGIPDFER